MRLALLTLLLFGATLVQAQIFLQLEKFENPRAEKYFIGDYFIYKHADFDDEWRKEKIESIDLESKTVFTSASAIQVDEFGQVRTLNPAVKAAGTSLKVFGAAWLVYGGIAYAADGFDFGTDTAAIGLGSILGGYVLEWLFYKNTYKLGTRHRVRLMDTRWQE